QGGRVEQEHDVKMQGGRQNRCGQETSRPVSCPLLFLPAYGCPSSFNQASRAAPTSSGASSWGGVLARQLPSAPARYSKNRHALAAACRERRERRASECRCVPATPRTCSQSLLHPPARRRREAGGPSLTSAAGPRRVRKTAGGTQT